MSQQGQNPKTAGTRQQIREAFPDHTAPAYVLRDRDGIYGSDFGRLLPTLVPRMWHEDLNEAARLPKCEMVEFLVAEKSMSPEAYVLCSLAADLHVTQAVDQTKGVHATIATAIFKD